MHIPICLRFLRSLCVNFRVRREIKLVEFLNGRFARLIVRKAALVAMAR